mgnify:FL=1
MDMSFIAPYFHVSPEFHVWSVQLGVIVLATICCNLLLLRLLSFLAQLAQKTSSLWQGAVMQAARVPMSFMVWLWSISAATLLLRKASPAQVFVHLGVARAVLLTLIVALFAIRLIGNMEIRLLRPHNGKQAVDATTVRAMGKLLRLVVFVLGTLMCLQTFGVSISGVLAFGGVGAMAIGFAAKDMLANFFGGLMVYLDRPFSVGDHIRFTSTKDIDGVVEDIGWRMTRIRNSEKRPLYIPNSLFASAVVENFSRMSHRHLNQTVGLRYDDAAKITAICDDVRHMLQTHPDIDNSQRLVVHFNAYNTSSLDLMVYCFTKATQFDRFHAVKQDVMLKIMDIVASHGTEFAFPTQTVFWAGQGGGDLDVATDEATEAASSGNAIN